MVLILIISEKIMNFIWTIGYNFIKFDYKFEENGGGGREIGILGFEGFLFVLMWIIFD